MFLQYVQYDLHYDFAWVTDEADCSVVLALLQVAFLGKCDDYGLGQRCWPFSSLPDLIADCCENGDYILSTCSFAGMSSTPADFPFFSDCTPPLLFEGRGGHPLCLSGGRSSTDGSALALYCTARCSILSIGSVSLVLL